MATLQDVKYFNDSLYVEGSDESTTVDIMERKDYLLVEPDGTVTKSDSREFDTKLTALFGTTERGYPQYDPDEYEIHSFIQNIDWKLYIPLNIKELLD